MRIAVTLNRGRTDIGLSHLDIRVAKNGIELVLPPDWLDFHPLTKVDLATEADYLSSIGYSLSVS